MEALLPLVYHHYPVVNGDRPIEKLVDPLEKRGVERQEVARNKINLQIPRSVAWSLQKALRVNWALDRK